MNLKDLFVLEVSAELALPREHFKNSIKKFGLDQARAMAMSTSVGGIGPLMRDRLASQSALGLNVAGVSLLFESVWLQKRSTPDKITLEKIEIGEAVRSLLRPTNLSFKIVLFDNTSVTVKVFETDYGQAKGYFLSAPQITTTIYPSEADAAPHTSDPGYWAHEFRLKQNWILGRGALTLCQALKTKPNFIIQSETPTVFSHHKLFRDPFQNDSFFQDTQYIFNDHTPLEYAHPLWDKKTCELVKVDQGLALSSSAWLKEKNHLDVTSFIIDQSDGVFGVSKMHQRTMKNMPTLKKYSKKITSITNGVGRKNWQATELQKTDKKTDQQLLQIKEKLRTALLKMLKIPTTGKNKVVLMTRRITPYKRLDILNQLLENEDYLKKFLDLPLILIVGGRLHQQDKEGQNMANHLLNLLSKNKKLQNRILFIDNFNVWEAPHLYQGADAALMISNKEKEASATGFMKSLLNGSAVIATADGAVPEIVQFDGKNKNGFLIGYKQDEPTTQELLKALTSFCKDTHSEANQASLIRGALNSTDKINIDRTTKEMTDLYSSLLSIHSHA